MLGGYPDLKQCVRYFSTVLRDIYPYLKQCVREFNIQIQIKKPCIVRKRSIKTEIRVRSLSRVWGYSDLKQCVRYFNTVCADMQTRNSVYVTLTPCLHNLWGYPVLKQCVSEFNLIPSLGISGMKIGKPKKY